MCIFAVTDYRGQDINIILPVISLYSKDLGFLSSLLPISSIVHAKFICKFTGKCKLHVHCIFNLIKMHYYMFNNHLHIVYLKIHGYLDKKYFSIKIR